MDKTDKIKQEEFPLPRYVQEVLSKHNISLPSLWGRGKGEGLLSLSHFTPLPFGEGKGEGSILNPAQIPIPFSILL